MPKTITPQELIDELKSGKWKKARKKLKRGEARCCLGVAVELAGAKFKFEGDGGELLDSMFVEGGTEPRTQWIDHNTPRITGGAPTWAPWLDNELQLKLASINDRTGGFDGAIAKLEKLDGGD